MRLERERSDGRRDFWEAKVSKQTIEFTSGIVNGRNNKTTRTFGSTKDLETALGKMVKAKQQAGFKEPTVIGDHVLPTALPTNPALEAALREDKSSGSCGVYADWLEAQGSVVGEWIALSAALEKKQDAKKAKRRDELARALSLPEPEFATWGTKHGFFEWLRLENSKDWMDAAFDPLAFARKLFATPLCAALDELRIGILRWDHNSEDVPAVLEAAADFGWARSLARLHLGDVSGDIDMAHHVIGSVGKVVSKAFPGLVSLKLHSGSQEWRDAGETFGLAGLALPKLERLVIETCAMTKRRIEHVLAAKLPKLTHLELWFGGDEADASLDDLLPLLDGTVFPKVTHLGLCNASFTGELAIRLCASPIARRLVHLDLSKGTLDSDYVTDFCAHAKHFRKLQTLDVDDNFLTKPELRELRAAFGKVEVRSTTQDKLEDAEDGDRFVSVAE